MKAIFPKITLRRFIGMVLGNVGLAVSVCFFRMAALGNDPFSGMMVAITEFTGVKYSICLITLNCFLFLFEIFKGRDMIGLGTLVNWFLIGYIVDFLYPFMVDFGHNTLMWQRIIYLALGVIITSMGCSMYQQAKAGIAPYDSISLIFDRETKVPYFWCRMATDVMCVIVCFALGGLLGIGTIICAFGLGPFISFFNRTTSAAFYGTRKQTTKNL